MDMEGIKRGGDEEGRGQGRRKGLAVDGGEMRGVEEKKLRHFGAEEFRFSPTLKQGGCEERKEKG